MSEPTIISEALIQVAAEHPDRVAVVVDGVGEMTYAAWDTASNQTARVLRDAGMQPGDRVGLFFSNDAGLSYLVSYMGIHKAGGVAVPLNTKYTTGELARVLAHSGARAILYEDRFAGQVADAGARGGPEIRLAGAALPEFFTGDEVSAPALDTRPEDLADILYTSGTTGAPKGVACTHDNILFKGASKLHKYFAGARFLHAVPLFTFAGTHAMTFMCLRGAMTQIVQPRFAPARFLELIAERRVNIAYAVPAMVLRCLNEPRAEEGGFDSLKVLMYGTAPMPPAAVKRLAQIFSGTFLSNLYGLTEGGAAVCSLPPQEALARPDSIGKPMPPTELRIVNADGEEARAGEAGEIWMRTKVRNRWYYRDDSASAEAWTDDGWLRTGDIGRLDGDGYLYLVDRIKDLIIVGGHNVSAPEVEGVLVEHEAVLDAAVIGVPHETMGEVPHACVVLRAEQTVGAEELVGFLGERLAEYKVPRRVSFLPELPRNALGKVLKRELRQMNLART